MFTCVTSLPPHAIPRQRPRTRLQAWAMSWRPRAPAVLWRRHRLGAPPHVPPKACWTVPYTALQQPRSWHCSLADTHAGWRRRAEDTGVDRMGHSATQCAGNFAQCAVDPDRGYPTKAQTDACHSPPFPPPVPGRRGGGGSVGSGLAGGRQLGSCSGRVWSGPGLSTIHGIRIQKVPNGVPVVLTSVLAAVLSA